MPIARDSSKDVSNGVSSATSLTLAAPGGNFGTGRLILSGCFISNAPSILTIPSGFTLVQQVDQFSVVGLKLAMKENSTGSEANANWSCSSNNELYGFAVAYTGVQTASSLDKAPAGTHSNGSQVSSLAGPATGTLTIPDELIFTVLGVGGAMSVPGCSGGGALVLNGSNRIAAFDQTVGSTASVTHTANWTNGNFADVITATFKAAATASGSGNQMWNT